jgi:hypothetical protein
MENEKLFQRNEMFLIDKCAKCCCYVCDDDVGKLLKWSS